MLKEYLTNNDTTNVCILIGAIVLGILIMIIWAMKTAPKYPHTEDTEDPFNEQLGI